MTGFAPDLPIRSSRLVDLNVTKLRLSSNLEQFPAYSYFTRFSPDGDPADYEVRCIDLDRDEIDPAVYASRVDPTFRAKRFRAGFYLVHYFGDPAYLVTSGRTFHVFGRRLERTVWPYFVKHILTILAADHGYLHLKAAGFVLPDGGATLLIGRNSGGKTVFLTQACLHGAEFLTNTHTLIRDGIAYGVPSSMRIRADECFGDLIAARALTEHMESGDYVVAPRTLFGPGGRDFATVRNLVIADYGPDQAPGLDEISAQDAELFAEQFAFAVTTYGLKDDLYAHYGASFSRFTSGLSAMREQLADLTRTVRCYRANVDMLDSPARSAALKLLGGRAGPA
jgi:hypothetical protein